jgi:drug/metabolite transporter (DMT)-like permease
VIVGARQHPSAQGGFLPALLLLALLLGSGYVWIGVSLGWLGEVEIAFCQVVVGAATLYAFVSLREQSAKLTMAEWRSMAILAVFANVCPSLLIPWAERVVDPGTAGITNATTPLFVLAITSFAGGGRIVPGRVLGFALGFGGVVIVGAPWSEASPPPIRLAALLLTALSYAFAYVYAGRVLSGTERPASVLAAAQLLAAAVILVPVLAVSLLISGWAAQGTPSLDAVLALLALGAGTIGAGYALNYRLLLRIGAVRTSAVTYLIPVVALCLGILLLDESATWNLFVGGAIVMTGVAIAERSRFQGANPEPVAARTEESAVPG